MLDVEFKQGNVYRFTYDTNSKEKKPKVRVAVLLSREPMGGFSYFTMWDFTINQYRTFYVNNMYDIEDVTSKSRCLEGDRRDSFGDKSVRCCFHNGKTYLVRLN